LENQWNDNFLKHDEIAKVLLEELKERYKKGKQSIEDTKMYEELFHPSREYIDLERKVCNFCG
jgi:hypothetical protein